MSVLTHNYSIPLEESEGHVLAVLSQLHMRPILGTLARLNTRQTNDVPITSLKQTLEEHNLFPISPGQQKTIHWGGVGATNIVLILIAGILAT
jgi:hypothetical protein